MSTDKQTNVGQELVERLQNLNKMLDAIRSAQFDELELPEIHEKNKSTVESKKLPKRNETNN
jgi:molybdenum-dependent DNA-binding transcriptional regulator ModE